MVVDPVRLWFLAAWPGLPGSKIAIDSIDGTQHISQRMDARCLKTLKGGIITVITLHQPTVRGSSQDSLGDLALHNHNNMILY